MRLESSMSALSLLANNEVVHLTMFALLFAIKVQDGSYISDDQLTYC